MSKIAKWVLIILAILVIAAAATAGAVYYLYKLPFQPLADKLANFAKQGLAQQTFDGRWNLTAEGFLLSNTVISDLLLVQDRTVIKQPGQR